MTEKIILEALLDKYEKSQVYKSQGTQNRRVMLKPSAFKKMDLEDYEQKSAFIDALRQLKADGIIDFEWMPFETGNLVAKLWLNQNAESIAKAYIKTGKNPTYTAYGQTLALISNYEFGYYSWMETFKRELIQKYEQSGKFGQLMSSDQQFNQKVIRCLIELDRLNGDTIHERVFSAQVLGDSKDFQKLVKPKLLHIMRRYMEDLDDIDPIQYLGILTNPDMLHFCGNIVIEFQNGNFDAGIFSHGTAMLTRYVDQIVCIRAESVKRVIFIENRTTYESYIEQKDSNCLVVYHGGFASKVKQIFFKMLSNSFPEAEFLHWSDFDLGGIRIFKAIKKTIPEIMPMYMDEEILINHLGAAIPMESDYLQKVKMALDSESDPLFRSMLETLLKYGVKLEQEQIKAQ
ncbi:MAG: DUF2220 domain-containing protein [Clostridiales bacterium]|nr:DUF2220 domain-containing protein [Clostridiales bacterium]